MPKEFFLGAFVAYFSFTTCEIGMKAPGIYSGNIADLAQIPADAAATMSMVHEYVHFLQLVSSLSGFALTGELIDFGIRGALILAGHGPGMVAGYQNIMPMLAAQPDHAGQGNAAISTA